MEKENSTSAPNKPGHRWLCLALFVVLICLGIAFLWWFFRQPSYGTITSSASPVKEEQNDPNHRKRYQGKYMTFTYPYDYRRQEAVEAVNYPLLERVYLSRSDVEGRKIALTIQDNTGNRFEEYSSLRIRQDDPKTYQREKIERNGVVAVLFSKNTVVFEKSIFFSRGNDVVSLVMSSPTTENGLREEVLTLFESFEWKGD